MKKIFLVEESLSLRNLLAQTLQLHEHIAEGTAHGVGLIEKVARFKPDLILIGLVRGMGRFNTLLTIRNYDDYTPVIVMTDKWLTQDLVKAFAYGCNDYVKTPIVLDELLARIKSLTGWGDRLGLREVVLGRYIFYPASQELRFESMVMQLSFKEYALLKKLCGKEDKVVERREILLELWGDDNISNGRSLNVYITKLRQYFEKDPSICIINVRGIGYKFIIRAL